MGVVGAGGRSFEWRDDSREDSGPLQLRPPQVPPHAGRHRVDHRCWGNGKAAAEVERGQREAAGPEAKLTVRAPQRLERSSAEDARLQGCERCGGLRGGHARNWADLSI
jgi:hypothetical protein